MAARTNIDMIVRSDALEKSGGDSFQVAKYKEFLEPLGFTVRFLPFHTSVRLSANSIVHIINIDRPYDFLAAVRMAGKRPVVVSSIHHDLSSVRLMRKAERRQGIRTIVGRILPESARELLAFAVRSLKKITSATDAKDWVVSLSWAVPRAATVWKSVGRALNEVDSVALLAEGERQSLIRDTSWSGKNGVLIPNGAPDSGPRGESNWRVWANRATDICVVGRVEPRKRQLEIASAASRHGLKVTFVGQASPSSPRYAADFEAAIAADDNLVWLGGLEHSQVLDVMGNSRVLLNASWVEVQSLVDIEGATTGCWVVVGRGGNSEEWLPNNVVLVDSHDIDVILSEVNRVLASKEGPQKAKYPYTWNMAAEELKRIYSTL